MLKSDRGLETNGHYRDHKQPERIGMGSQNCTAYEYTKLGDVSNQLRLLELAPDDSEQGCVQGELKTKGRSEVQGKYQALSYTWGSNIKDKAILIEGRELKITTNLLAALRRLRTSGDRILWIDAICINQEDTHERSKQVAKMTSTFADAQEVIAWLGEDSADHDISTVLSYIEEVSKMPEGSLPCDAHTIMNEWIPQYGAAFARFFERPWWHRKWIFQEAFVAPRAQLMCGIKTLPWNKFMAGLDQLHLHLIHTTAYHASIANILKNQRQWDTPAQLGVGNVLHTCQAIQHLGCADARDHIAALLGLWPNIEFRVDYAASIYDNYLHFARFWAEQEDCAELFDCALVFQHRHQSNETELPWPSWVPDWRFIADKVSDSSKTLGSFNFLMYSFLRPMTKHIKATTTDRILTLSVHKIGQIGDNCASPETFEATFLCKLSYQVSQLMTDDIFVAVGNAWSSKLFVLRPCERPESRETRESFYHLVANCDPESEYLETTSKALEESPPPTMQICII